MTRALAGVLLLLTTAPVRADMGPILPATKHAHASYRIEAADTFSDHVFIIYRNGFQYDATANQWNQFDEWDYIEITPDKPLTLKLGLPADGRGTHGQRAKESVVFVSVPRAAAGGSAKDAYRKASSGPGEIWMGFEWRQEVPSWAGSEITITYRVQKASPHGVELVRTSPNPMRQWVAAAISLAVAIVLGGLWLVRRTFRRAHPRS